MSFDAAHPSSPTAEEPDSTRADTDAGGACAHLPLPPAMTHLRRDPRGYPVPVVVPWEQNRPQFAAMSVARTLLVAKHRLCGICGLALEPTEPYWHNSDADHADLYEAALAAGNAIAGRRSPEAGGHRECILYAAAACPFLSEDRARTRDAASGGELRPKGEQRGAESLVVAVRDWAFEMSDRFVGFHLDRVVEVVRYRSGTELVSRIADAIAAAPARVANPDAPALWDASLRDQDIERLAIDWVHTHAQQASRPGRNELCPCGSGVKFKRCCGR